MQPGPGERDEATALLRAAGTEEAAGDRLAAVLYDQLRALAGRALAGEREDHTLQATALVHEVWLRLFEPEQLTVRDRQHFLALAARTMRRLLVDHARARRRLKRGRGWQRVGLDGLEPPGDDATPGVDLLDLDEALTRLADESPRSAQVVELRYFGGLSVEETADALTLSQRSVAREWRYARAWLAQHLDEADPP